MRPLVIIESPYAGEVERNVRYARLAMRDSILRGERPFASHLLYTQPGILDDSKPTERALGIGLGFDFWEQATLIAFYVDLGWSRGMLVAKERRGVFRFDERRLPGWEP